MDLMSLLNQVKQAIFNDPSTPHREGHDPSGLIGQIEGMFGQHQNQYQNQRQVLPASQDPYGDPADAGQGNYAYMDQGYPSNVRPASEDPLGDPADQEPGQGFGNQGYRQAGYGNQFGNPSPNRQFPNLRPASEDPLGDPADQ